MGLHQALSGVSFVDDGDELIVLVVVMVERLIFFQKAFIADGATFE